MIIILKQLLKMFKTTGKFLFKLVGGKHIGKVVRWGFMSMMFLWGPGPVIALVGVEGLIGISVITQTGLLEYAGDKIVKKL